MDAAVREKVWSLLNVGLRVPFVFIMDSIMNAEFGLRSGSINEDSSDTADEETTFDYFTISSILWFLLYLFAFIMSFGAFLLRTKPLLQVYLVFSSLGVILWSYIWNHEFIKFTLELLDNDTNLAVEMITFDTRTLAQTAANYTIQLFLALVFSFGTSLYSTNNNNDHSPFRIVSLWTVFIGPTFVCFCASLLPRWVLLALPIVSAAGAHCFWVVSLLSNIDTLVISAQESWLWARTALTHYGFASLLSMQWNRLHVPQVLRVFWLVRLAEHATHLVSSGHLDNLPAMGGELLSRGCETLVAVVGMSSIVSSISHFIARGVRDFLQAEDAEERSVGTVSALLFLVLALQTGLTQMESQKRLSRLYRNFCLLAAAVLHFLHSMLNSTLVLLSASQNISTYRHVRALLLSVVLLALPCGFLVYLWSHHTLSTWLLAVTAFSTEVIIKVIISIVVYMLFLVDARYTGDIWEGLDDYVFYVRATGSFIEFIFGVFLLLNGTWIFFFEAGGTIRAMMMCFHAYFNIWQQAQNGWETCMRRRNAATKLATLKEATTEQLAALDDVCAICYQNMQSAKITRCNHFFHRVCIRKWLYLQDLCPLCHSNLWWQPGAEGQQQQRVETAALGGGDDDFENLAAPPFDEGFRDQHHHHIM